MKMSHVTLGILIVVSIFAAWFIGRDLQLLLFFGESISMMYGFFLILAIIFFALVWLMNRCDEKKGKQEDQKILR